MPQPADDSGAAPPPAAVAVITRTRDRPLLLARAAASVAGQTFSDLVWMVVNDGGDETALHGVLARSTPLPVRRQLLSTPVSAGMEAAAASGVAATTSRYIAVHDDDDSWHPSFLARTVAFLDSAAGARYGGVVTHAEHVSEEITEGRVIERGRRPCTAGLASVQLSEMLAHNLFPPITFLFRREVYQRAGGFNAQLAVLGDWYFNIRFLLEADIAVLPEPLAYWHHRDVGRTTGAYANSVIGGLAAHDAHNALVRNALVRDLAHSGSPALAPLLGYLLAEQRREMAGLRRALGTGTAAQVELQPGGGATAPSAALAAVVDIADRRWTLAQLPLLARLRLQRRGREPQWPELIPHLAQARLLPPADFDEAAYRASHADVAAAVASGQLVSGYHHYIRFGRLEGRPRPLRLP